MDEERLNNTQIDTFIYRNLRGVKYPVLPTEYDDALSYYEAIQKVYYAVQEALKYIYGFSDSVVQEANDYTDQQISILNGQLRNAINAVDGKYADLYAQIVVSMGQLTVKVNELYQAWSEYQEYLDFKFDNGMIQLKQYIDSLLVDRVVYVINPITGQMDSLQNTLNMMWQRFSEANGITAGEYDALQIKAQLYDSQSFTADEYDSRARQLVFFYKRIYLTMSSPFTGEMELYDVVINQLADLHKNALTAQEYDAKDVVAQAYDAGQHTAYEYDWNAKAWL